MAKRNQKPEVRKAQREQAVRAAKDQKKTTVKKPAVKVRNCQSVAIFFMDFISSGLLDVPCFSPMLTLYYIQDKAAQKAQKATKNVQKAGPGRVGGKR